MPMAYLMLHCDTEDKDVTVRLGLHDADFFVSTLNGDAHAALQRLCDAHGKPIPYGDLDVTFDLHTLEHGAVALGTTFHLSYEDKSFYDGTVVKRDARIYP